MIDYSGHDPATSLLKVRAMARCTRGRRPQPASMPPANQALGGVAERLIAPVLKTGRPKGLVSSNLTPSASLIIKHLQQQSQNA